MRYGQIFGKYSMLRKRVPLLDSGIAEHSDDFLPCVLLLLEGYKGGQGQWLGLGSGAALHNRWDPVFPHLYLYAAHDDLYGNDADGDHGCCIAVGVGR